MKKNSEYSNFKTLKWICGNSKKYIPAVILSALLSATTSVAVILLAYVSSYVIDIATGKKTGDVVFYVVMLFVIILFQAVLMVVNANFNIRVSGKLEISFKQKMFTSLMKKEYKSISKIHSGDILNRFTSDIDIVVGGIVNILPATVSILARLIAAFVVLVAFSKQLAAVIAGLGVVMCIAARIYSRFIKKIHKEVQQSYGETRSYMQECTENIVVVKSFNTAGSFGEKLKEFMLRTYKLKLKRTMIGNISNVSQYILFTGGYYAVLAWGAFSIGIGTFTYGTLTALLSIVSQIRRPITTVSGIIPQYFATLASAERIMELDSLTSEPEALPQSDINKIYSGMSHIRFCDVTFSYEENRPIIENANMLIKKGEMVALIGGSGEGKSTIFRQLLGLYKPTYGKIIIEGDTHAEISASVRGLFAYVPQGNLILSGTIGDNIRFCKKDATEKEVEEAARCADLYDFIMTLSEGFNTTVGERGIGLSEGQLQRVSIARALLSEAPILLLDECTSALDAKTEKIVLNNIKEKANHTAIIISHRPAALKICDKVYSVTNGKVSLVEKEPATV